MVLADEIPVAHTPAGFWQGELPPPVLMGCTEPLAAGIPDLRGLWRAYAGEAHGTPIERPDHLERIEQCGNRVVITAGGVVHDMRVDGTLEHGVNDIDARTGQPIRVAATIEAGKLTLRPFNGPIAVTRALADGELVIHFVIFDRVLRLRRA